jgi:predicted aldo/keto reductase-like oxidoreductase
VNRHSGEKPLRATDCYRFVMSHQAVDVCMSGPRNMEERRRALKALQLGPQSAGELKQVQRIGDHVHANYRRFLDKKDTRYIQAEIKR